MPTTKTFSTLLKSTKDFILASLKIPVSTLLKPVIIPTGIGIETIELSSEVIILSPGSIYYWA